VVSPEPALTRLRTLALTRTGSALDGTYAAILAGVCGVYVAAAKLGIELSVAHGVITPVWAPTGIALAALVLFGRRIWPAVAVGALIANATSGASVPDAAFISVGNTLEAVVGATLLLRVGFRPGLDRVRDVLALVLLGAVASTTISATNGVTTLWASGAVSGSSYGSNWLLWWVGDGMGDLIVAPLLLVWGATRLRRPSRPETVEALALLALLIGVSSFVFLAGHWRYPHLVFPLLVWATLRFGQRGAATGSFVVGAIAIAGAVHGTTPLGNGSATQVVQILEGLLAAVAVSLLILGAVLAERGAAETALERAHANLTEAQEVARIGSWEWSVPENSVTWSDELYRLYGLEPQSVPLRYESFLEYVHSDDRTAIRAAVERAYVEGGSFAVEHRVAMPDGDIRWLQGRGRVVTDENGTPVRMVGTSQDITERKRFDELRESILSAVSHELRTPLTSVVGFALTLEQQRARLAEDERAEMVTHLAEQAQKLDRLLGDLLDLDRLRRGRVRPVFRPTDVGQLVSRVAGAFPSDSHPIEVRTESITAQIDEPKVERIVENLLSNAVKHTAPGTPVQVRVERCDEGALIAVDDRGPGVLESERGAIFEMFNRGVSGVPDAPGTGVGLALVTQFVSLHGGRVWVEDRPDGGASFRVVLPVRPT
jgi:PAS domain S-box-containing protein